VSLKTPNRAGDGAAGQRRAGQGSSGGKGSGGMGMAVTGQQQQGCGGLQQNAKKFGRG